jgi:hypothetical protein
MLWAWAKAVRAVRCTVDLLKDLFFGVGNKHLDLARVIAGLFAGLCAFAIYWNAVHLDREIDLTAAFTGLATVATALAALIAAKDYVRSKFEGKDE